MRQIEMTNKPIMFDLNHFENQQMLLSILMYMVHIQFEGSVDIPLFEFSKQHKELWNDGKVIALDYHFNHDRSSVTLQTKIIDMENKDD